MPVWPTCVEYGYQPASTTARVARDRAAERLRELLDERELLGLAEAAAAGDDHVGVLDRRPALLRVRLLDHLGARARGPQLGLDVLDRAGRAGSAGSKRAGAEEAEPRRRRPADVDDDRVRRARALADERAAVGREVGQLPVEPGVEPGGEPGRDVGGEDRLREEDGLEAVLVDELREHVDARLRQRRLERGSSAT